MFNTGAWFSNGPGGIYGSGSQDLHSGRRAAVDPATLRPARETDRSRARAADVHRAGRDQRRPPRARRGMRDGFAGGGARAPSAFGRAGGARPRSGGPGTREAESEVRGGRGPVRPGFRRRAPVFRPQLRSSGLVLHVPPPGRRRESGNAARGPPRPQSGRLPAPARLHGPRLRERWARRALGAVAASPAGQRGRPHPHPHARGRVAESAKDRRRACRLRARPVLLLRGGGARCVVSRRRDPPRHDRAVYDRLRKGDGPPCYVVSCLQRIGGPRRRP